MAVVPARSFAGFPGDGDGGGEGGNQGEGREEGQAASVLSSAVVRDATRGLARGEEAGAGWIKVLFPANSSKKVLRGRGRVRSTIKRAWPVESWPAGVAPLASGMVTLFLCRGHPGFLSSTCQVLHETAAVPARRKYATLTTDGCCAYIHNEGGLFRVPLPSPSPASLLGGRADGTFRSPRGVAAVVAPPPLSSTSSSSASAVPSSPDKSPKQASDQGESPSSPYSSPGSSRLIRNRPTPDVAASA
jgi:hypothetical protein